MPLPKKAKVTKKKEPEPETSNGYDGELPAWFQELPDEKVIAFKEAISLLEYTLPHELEAQPLHDKLVKVDSTLTLIETQRVIDCLVRDKDGKVDFEEFIASVCTYMGEDTSKAAAKEQKTNYTYRQHVFYSAFFLTLKKMYDENETKESTGNKLNVETPLDRKSSRLERQLKKIQEEYRDKNKNKPSSPYAQSMLLPPPDQPHKKSLTTLPKRSFVTHPLNKKKHRFGQEFVTTPKSMKFTKAKPRDLWNEHNIYLHKVKFPIIKIPTVGKTPSFHDLPKIRKEINKHVGRYLNKVRTVTAANAEIHWNNVYSEAVKPHKLMKDFKDVFWSYSKRKSDSVYAHHHTMAHPYINSVNVKL